MVVACEEDVACTCYGCICYCSYISMVVFGLSPRCSLLLSLSLFDRDAFFWCLVREPPAPPAPVLTYTFELLFCGALTKREPRLGLVGRPPAE